MAREARRDVARRSGNPDECLERPRGADDRRDDGLELVGRQLVELAGHAERRQARHLEPCLPFDRAGKAVEVERAVVVKRRDLHRHDAVEEPVPHASAPDRFYVPIANASKPPRRPGQRPDAARHAELGWAR